MVALDLVAAKQKAIVLVVVMRDTGGTRRTVRSILAAFEAAIAALERQATQACVTDEAVAVTSTGGADAVALRLGQPDILVVVAARGK